MNSGMARCIETGCQARSASIGSGSVSINAITEVPFGFHIRFAINSNSGTMINE